jgi:hypothetical protein
MSAQEFFLPESEEPPSTAVGDSFASALSDVTAIILESDLARTVFNHFSRIIELHINTVMAIYSEQDMRSDVSWEDMPHGQFRQLLEDVEKSRQVFGTNLAAATAERDKKMQEDEEFASIYSSIEKGFDNLVKTQGVKHTVPKSLHKKAEILRQIKTSL